MFQFSGISFDLCILAGIIAAEKLIPAHAHQALYLTLKESVLLGGIMKLANPSRSSDSIGCRSAMM